MRAGRVFAGTAAIGLGAVLGAMMLSGEKLERIAPEVPPVIAGRDEKELIPPEVPEPRGEFSARKAIDELPAAGEEEEDSKGTLLVRVVDPWDRQVTGVWIGVERAGGNGNLVVGSWRGGGRLQVRLPTGMAHRIEARGNDLLFEPAFLEPVYAEDEEVTLRLPAKGGRIAGRIVAAEGREPLDGAGLVAMVSGEEETHSLTRNSLPGGAFDFLMTAGEIELRASAPGRETRAVGLSLRAGDWIRDVEIALPIATSFSLAGRVVDDAGAPVSGADVVLASLTTTQRTGAAVEILDNSGEATTDAAGRFRVDGLSSAEQVVEVRARGCEPTGRFSLALGGGENEVEIVLLRGGKLRLRAVLHDGSAPLLAGAILRRGDEEVLRVLLQGTSGAPVVRERRHYRVFGVPARESAFPSKVEERTEAPDAEGYVTVEGVAPGSYEVRVDAMAWVDAGGFEGRSAVSVVPGETVTVEVRLSARR